MTAPESLLEGLPQAQRLALAYAPRLTRARLTSLLALDARLAGIVRNSREPMLAQLRLAWWREQLAADLTSAPEGEPLLAALVCWNADRQVLGGLADAWEVLTGAAPLAEAAFAGLANARAAAIGLVAGQEAAADPVIRMARNWALADLAGRLSHPDEIATVRGLVTAQDWTQLRLPRAFRPIAMLHAMAVRNLASGDRPSTLRFGTSLAMIRIGLLGR